MQPVISEVFEAISPAVMTAEVIVPVPIPAETIATVTSNVVLLTAVILVAYAVMEVVRGLLNTSTWLFELPMPAVFKASIKGKPMSLKRKDDD
jgi:hypothetical protein